MRMNRETEALMVEVAYLCGFSVNETAAVIHGRRDGEPARLGPVKRIITTMNLAQARRSEGRPARLVEIERARPDLAVFVANCARQGQVRATSVLLNFTANAEHRPELIARRRLREDMALARAAVPEPRIHPEVRGKGADQIIYNQASCNLTWLAAKDLLPQWAVDAGVKLRGHWMAAGASIGSIDYEKPIVDGGPAPGRSDSSLDASGYVRDSIEAVQFIFPGRDQRARIAMISHAVFESRALSTFPFIVNSPSAFLREALEPVAWVYGTLLDGDVARRLKGRG